MANSVKYLSYDGLKKFTSSIGQSFASEIRGTTATNSISIYPVAKYKEYNENNGTLSTTYSEKVLTGVEIPLAGASTATNAGLVAASEYAKLKNLNVNHWYKINDIVPDTPTDTLTITGGTNVTVTNDATNDKITISSPNVGVTFDGGGNVITGIESTGHGIKFTKGKSVYSTSEVYTKDEVDDLIDESMVSALEYKGTISTATTSPGAFTPAATKGNVYVVSGSGYINGVAVEEGDMFLCKADTVAAATSANYATIQASWNVVNVNWNVVDNKKVLPQNGTTYEIAKVGGHSIHVGVEANTTTGSVSATQTPSHGGSFSIITGGSFSGNKLTFNTGTVTLPSESVLSVKSKTGTDITGSHGGTFDVVTGITGSGHTVTYTVSKVTLPSETTLSKGSKTATASTSHGGTFTALTDFTVSGHTITATVTTYTLPSVPNVSVTSGTTATTSPGHGGTFDVISGIETNGHGIKINTTKVTLPSDNNTQNTAGSIDISEKLFLVGAKSQTASSQTYSHDTAFVDKNGILNSGSATVCASASTVTHVGTMVITCNDKITNADIDALFA